MMFNSTITKENEDGLAGSSVSKCSSITRNSDHNIARYGKLPSELSFPHIARLSKQEEQPITSMDGTLDAPQLANDFYTKLSSEINQAFLFACDTFHGLDENQMKLALAEAQLLARSGLFGDELFPNVSVDPYGEFTFSHRSNAGYIDIGVRGERELSYHVRNDVDLEATAFDDYDWANYDVPQSLFIALNKLRQHL